MLDFFFVKWALFFVDVHVYQIKAEEKYFLNLKTNWQSLFHYQTLFQWGALPQLWIILKMETL